MDPRDHLLYYNSYNGVKADQEYRDDQPIGFPYLDIVSSKRVHTVEIDFFRKTLPDLPYRLLLKYIIEECCQGKYIGGFGTWCMGKFRTRERLIKCCHHIGYIYSDLSEVSVVDDLLAKAGNDYRKVVNSALFND
jgi:hypothetical protein